MKSYAELPFLPVTGFAQLCSAAAFSFLLAGCAGSARLDIVSLDASSIDPPPTTIYHYNARECYAWTEPPGDTVIAMDCRPDTLFTPLGPAKLKLSLVLRGGGDKSSFQSRVGRREVRGLFQWGLERHCFISYAGIVSVNRRPNGRMYGSFRLLLWHQPGPGLLDLFPRHPSQVLFVGTFDAVPERDNRGHALRDATEAHGWHRDNDPPASQRQLQSGDRKS